MNDAFRNDKPLSRLQLHRTILQIDDEAPVEHKKEFIVVVVLVPVLLALHYAEPDDGTVYLA